MNVVVRAAGFSPVKGMRHLDQGRMSLDARGAVGDRAFCLVDPSGARVLRTVQHPSLLAVTARVDDAVLSLTLPSGETVSATPERTGESLTCDYWGRAVELDLLDGPHAAAMGDLLDLDVRLAAAPRGGVVFGAPITVIGTASLRACADALGEAVDPARFRATLVVETDEPWVEDSWLGSEVPVGDARLRIGGPVPRCAVIDHHPATGEKDLRLLKALAQIRPTNRAGEPMFGVYAECVAPGVVATPRE